MPWLSEALGFVGAYDALREIESSSEADLTADELERIMTRHGVEDPSASLQDLVANSILRRYGESYCLTTLGVQATLLLGAINGGDLREIYRRLCQLNSELRAYEMVREGMTRAFLRSLLHRPGFGRLYVCSPWISLDREQEHMLRSAVAQTWERRGVRPELLVITRPEQGTDLVPPATLSPFQDLGASLFLHKRLHTKLYIREPDSSGGYIMAILGSQNLTKSRYVELGIRINSDCTMINQLIAYFLELTNHCYEIH